MGRFLYRLVPTEYGWAGVAGSKAGVTRVSLPAPDRACALAVLKEGRGEEFVETEHEFGQVADDVAAYFGGERVELACKLDLSGFTEFQREVWEAARKIGYGEIRSYKWVADTMGRPGAARAVGQALSKNPVPVIVPCNRVVRADGGLGGFGSGLRWKIMLLEMERRRKGSKILDCGR